MDKPWKTRGFPWDFCPQGHQQPIHRPTRVFYTLRCRLWIKGRVLAPALCGNTEEKARKTPARDSSHVTQPFSTATLLKIQPCAPRCGEPVWKRRRSSVEHAWKTPLRPCAGFPCIDRSTLRVAPAPITNRQHGALLRAAGIPVAPRRPCPAITRRRSLHKASQSTGGFPAVGPTPNRWAAPPVHAGERASPADLRADSGACGKYSCGCG